MLDIQNVGEYMNQFKIKLTDKLNGFDTAFNLPMDKPEFSSIIDKICNFISDMIDYNRIIQVYLNPSNTPQTRDAILNKIEPLKSIFQKMLKHFERLVDDLLTKNEARLYSKFLIKTLRTYALYEILDDQFKTNNLYVIAERDIENQMMKIIRESPDLGDIIKAHNLDLKPPPAPPPPPTPKAMPPAAAPAPAFPAAAASMAAPSVVPPRLPTFPSYPYAGLPRAIYETPTAKASAPPQPMAQT
jgi:hypothetical protein